MVYIVIAVLAIAVAGLAFALVKVMSGSDDQQAASQDMERRLAELMQAQQALVGKVDAVSQQQVAS